jgi:hypothetical protein
MSKKLVYLISFAVALGFAENVPAADYRDWDDADPSNHLWSSPVNWNPDGLPTLIGDNNNRTRIREGSPGPDRGYPILDATIFAADPNGAFADRVYVGDSSNHSSWSNEAATLTVTGGARLTIGNDLKIAYGTYTRGILYVDGDDTVIEIGEDLMVGRRGEGILDMSGGTINVAADLRIPEESDNANIEGSGLLNLYGGTIIVGDNLQMRPEKSGKIREGNMNVAGGTLIIAGNATDTVEAYINNGWITAYDGNGTLNLDFDVTNPGSTTLTATHLLNPNPAHGSTATSRLEKLQWTLPEPNAPGAVVTCDVYFGTDPNVEANPKIVTRQAVESVPVTLAPETVYYWAIDPFDDSVSTTEPLYLGPIFTFNTFNTAPVVEAGDDIDTWLDGAGPRVVQLNGSASDDGPVDALTYRWTVIAEPNGSSPAQISDPLVADPTVTVVEPGMYSLQLEVGDGEYTATDTIQVALYADACEHASNQEGFEWIPGDINHDCIVDDLDLAILEDHWLQWNYSVE